MKLKDSQTFINLARAYTAECAARTFGIYEWLSGRIWSVSGKGQAGSAGFVKGIRLGTVQL